VFSTVHQLNHVFVLLVLQAMASAPLESTDFIRIPLTVLNTSIVTSTRHTTKVALLLSSLTQDQTSATTKVKYRMRYLAIANNVNELHTHDV